MVDLVLTCEEEENDMKKKQSENRVSIVSNTIELFRTFLNIM